MLKVYLTKGLPASGKTTWAKEQLRKNPDGIKRINKDDLRAMLDDARWSGKSEKFILQARDQLILSALEYGKHVIVDDTNFHPKNEARIRELVAGKAEIEIVDFTHVPLEECLARDRKRQNNVGEIVIRDMHKKYLAREEMPKFVPYNHELPDCYVFDIDGTLALRQNRSPFEWDKVGQDVLNEPVGTIYRSLRNAARGCKFFLVSGRDDVCRQQTETWLDSYTLLHSGLFMRPQGDMRQDAIVKEEIYRQHIEGKYNVLAVFDDRNQTVRKWRELGLPCFQVADGDF